ncbi:MAG: hypothetical protein QGI60_01200 [archaeon]|jgi:hypothetical protein|nr:hypothetical protein [archaeon]
MKKRSAAELKRRGTALSGVFKQHNLHGGVPASEIMRALIESNTKFKALTDRYAKHGGLTENQIRIRDYLREQQYPLLQ